MSGNHTHNGQGSGEPAHRGTIVLDASALIALNESTGKNGHTYVEILPFLAREGFRIVIPKPVAAAVPEVLGKKGATELTPVEIMLRNIGEPPYPNMEIVPASPEVIGEHNAVVDVAGKLLKSERAPVYVVANSNALLGDIASKHPDINIATTTTLLTSMVKTGVIQKLPGVDSGHTNAITAHNGKRERSDVTNPAPIDSLARAYANFGPRSSMVHRGEGPLGEAIKRLAVELRAVPALNGAHGHNASYSIAEPKGSYVATEVEREKEAAAAGTAVLDR